MNVTVRYGDLTALDALTLQLIAPITALTGPNGSGKTTVTRLLLGLLQPTSGEVKGIDGLRKSAAFQEPRLCEQLGALANIRLVLPRATGEATAKMGLAAVGLPESLWNQPVNTLSGGQRHRVALVRALAPQSDLVVLDEPYAGLDPDARGLALAWTSERLTGRRGLVVTHDLTDAIALGAAVVRLVGSDHV